MIFDLVKDYADVLGTMPKEHHLHRIVKLLDEALRRDVHFIERYPTTFFQCMWNTCWWYDCSYEVEHCVPPEDVLSRDEQPGKQSAHKLFKIFELWRREKESSTPGFVWFRSLRSPRHPLSQELITVLRGHDHTITDLDFGPEGRLLVSGSADGTVRLWNLADGQLLRLMDGFEGTGFSIPSVKLSSDERWIARSGTTHYFERKGYVGLFYGGGSLGDRSLQLWNVRTGDLVWSFSGKQTPLARAVTPDGTRLATVFRDGSLGIYRLPRDAGMQPDNANKPGPKTFRECTLDIDGTLVVSDISTGTETTHKPKQTSPIASKQLTLPLDEYYPDERLWCSSDNTRIYIRSRRYQETIVSVHNGKTAQILCHYTLAEGEEICDFAQDADEFVTCRNSVVQIRSAATGNYRTQELKLQSFGDVRISPNGQLLCVAALKHSDPNSGCIRKFSRIGKTFVSEPSIPLLRPYSGKIRFAPEGRSIAVFTDYVVCVFRVFDGYLVFHQDWSHEEFCELEDVRLMSNDRLIIIMRGDCHDNSNVIYEYDIDSGNLTSEYSFDSNANYICAHMLDQQRILFSQLHAESSIDGHPQHLRVFNPSTGEQQVYIRGHGYGIGEVCFSEDNSQLTAVCSDGCVRTWAQKTGVLIRQLKLDLNLWREDGYDAPGIIPTPCPISVGHNMVGIGTHECFLVWDLKTHRRVAKWHHPARTSSPYPLSLGRRHVAFYFADLNQIRIHDLRSEAPDMDIPYPLNEPPVGLVLSADGKWLIAGGGPLDPSVLIWKLPEGKLLHELDYHSYEVLSVAVDDKSSLVASGGYDGAICIWRVNRTGSEINASGASDRYGSEKMELDMELDGSPGVGDGGNYWSYAQLDVTETATLRCAGLASPTVLENTECQEEVAWLNAPLYTMKMINGELHGWIPMQRYEHVYSIEGMEYS